jgi:Sensors of blue-light using FAD
VIQLIYSSNAVKPFSPEVLRTLLVRARAHNTTTRISGMLLHVDGAFLQVLEGDVGVVHALFARIGGDTRHAKVVLLLQHEIATRNFPDWSMGFFDASGRGASLPGYRRNAGFADLLGDTARITRVVADFRDGRWRSLAV